MFTFFGIVLIILIMMMLGLGFSYVFWWFGKRELTFPEFLNKYGYALGYIGFILMLVTIALVKTHFH